MSCSRQRCSPRKPKRPPRTRGWRPLSRTASTAGSYAIIRNGDFLRRQLSEALRVSWEQSPYVSGDFKKANPHTYTSWKMWYPVGQFERKWSNGIRDLYAGQLGTWCQVPTYANGGSTLAAYIARTDSTRRAIHNFYTQLKQSENNLATTLAEWQQVRRMVSYENITSIIRQLLTFQKRSLDFAKIKVKEWVEWASSSGRKKKALGRKLGRRYRRCDTVDQVFFNRWLELKYGWMPFLSELYELAKFSRSFWFKAVIEGKSTLRENEFSKFIYDGSPPGEVRRYVTYRAQYRAVVTLENPFVHDISRITSLNPLGIAWELTPLSFVFDWFIDVGSYLADLETSIGYGLKLQTGHSTKLVGVVNAGLVVGSHKDSGGNTNTAKGAIPFLEQLIYRDRKPLTAFPFPYLPAFEPRLGWQRCISGAALLYQRQRAIIGELRKYADAVSTALRSTRYTG